MTPARPATIHPEDTTVHEITAASGTDPSAAAPRRSRRRLAIVAIVLVAVVAGIAGIAVSRASPNGAGAAPHFVEEAAAAGLTQSYSGDYPYVVGGGVAAFDCDADGKPDLYLAGGEGKAGLYRNRSAVGGALAFERVPSDVTDLTAVTGAYPIDIDGDGIVDLAVLRIGENEILRGLGACRFERANDRFGIDGGKAWTTAFSATWEGDATLPTLAFGNYLSVDGTGQPTLDCDTNFLVRPAAGGTTYGTPTPLAPGYCPLSMLFSDWDRSGRSDLRVSNDRHYYRDGQEQLWRVEPGTAPRLYTAADGWADLQLWGMGIASQDLTGDGYPEVFLTSQGDNKLQTLAQDGSRPAYQDIALKMGVTSTRPFAGGDNQLSTAWDPAFGDLNDDGRLDLFISKGNVGGEAEHASKDPSDLLLGQADGTFAESTEAAGLLQYSMARGVALVDLNLDGALDLVQVVRNDNVQLYRNVGSGDAATPRPMGHWLEVGLDQPGPNRDAIGALVEVRVNGQVTQQEVTIGGGHVSGQLGWLHSGLGDATSADVRVTWPGGDVGPWMTVAADGFVRIERGAAEPTPWTPAP